MLRELRVRNLGLLGEVHVTLEPGLNALTGETGAGKTLLVTSLALLAGGRSDAQLAAGGDATVEAVVETTPALRAVLDARGIDADEETILARRIGTDGRSRAWINGSLVPVGVLAEAGRTVVEIHGQGESFALARPLAQLDALDAFAGTLGLRGSYGSALARARALDAEIATLTERARERTRAIDVLSFQIAEIEAAAIDPARDEGLLAELARLEHAERLGELGAVAALRTGAEGAAGLLAEAAAAMTQAAGIDPSARPAAARLASLAEETSDTAAQVRAWTDTLETDPRTLEELRERVALLGALRRKYGDGLPDVLRFAEQARATLASLEGSDARRAELARELDEVRAALDGLAAELTAKRSSAARRLASAVRSELPALALPNAVFEAIVEPGAADCEHGRDAVGFAFSANPGRPAGPLGRIASGGELSRVMIAVTLALAGRGDAALVFDEADQGVGGEAALELGRRLAALAAGRQVLVVTHLAQIAAFADLHAVVQKTGSTVSLGRVDGEERITEISRMLAGLGSSERARAHAAELVQLAGAAAAPRE